MGHRDNLLTAARRCLLDKGYASTTVRDLVSASGANLASISYHFGSKEQLLSKALLDLNSEWGRTLFEALDSPGGAQERWENIISSIDTNRRLWIVNFESVTYVDRDPEVRALYVAAQENSRTALARAFGTLPDDASPDDVRAVGSHYYSILVGLAIQVLTDPDTAPTAADVVRAEKFTSS